MGQSDELVVLTGAEGRIGAGFREEYLANYNGAYALRLAVRDPDFRDERFADVAVFDLEDFETTKAILTGARAVVHLAANPDERSTFNDLMAPNVIGAYNLFEAARQANCKRVIFASSCHAVLAYPRGFQIHEDQAPRPDCVYGATKVFGEALCSAFSRQFGMSCIALRIGVYVEQHRLQELGDADPDVLEIVVTQRDLAKLIHRCIVAPSTLSYGVFHGISNNRWRRMDIERAKTVLAYEPSDDAFSV